MADGRLVHGPEVTDWGTADATPKLGDHNLLGPGNSARWLRDNTLRAARPRGPFVELIGGDRLPGKPLAMRGARQQIGGLSLPDHLVVEPSVVLKDSNNRPLKQVRVIVRMIRRIVWKPLSGDRYRPATLFGRDGRTLSFRRHRLLPEAVSLLTPAGIKEIPFDEIAELHLPAADPWEAYYDELAALSPGLGARVFQIETSAGLSATASTVRFRVPSYSQAANPNTWYHLIQPAWSLDAFAVGHREIHMRRFFAPGEVPLSRIAPLRAENRSVLHSGWRWQSNRNVYGRPLHSGRNACAWGFGVHGLSELTFRLPPAARAFRSRLKIDDASGSGGCVRASVALSAGRRGEDVGAYEKVAELYRSELLIGSKNVLNTGELQLAAAGENKGRLLTLAVDPVNSGHPKNADPLDIRDALNWLDPVVVLDRNLLLAEVRRQGVRQIAPWSGWTLEAADKSPLRLIGRWNAELGRGIVHRFVVAPAAGKLTIGRTVSVGPGQQWLLVSAALPDEETPSSKIEIRVDGEVAAEYVVPARQNGADEPSPLALPLDGLTGRKVKLEIVQRPLDKNAREGAVDWRAINFTGYLPLVREVFEDRAEFVALPAGGKPQATVELIGEGAYSGAGCVKITPGSRFRISFGEKPIPIRAHPKWNEFRYVRFAFRKRGQGQVELEFHRFEDGEQDHGLHYFAGRGESPVDGAQRAWRWSTRAGLPDAWIVETRDLFSDFGGFEGGLTDLILSCTGGDHVLFDHVYLGRTASDFDSIRVERIASPEAATEAAQAAMAETALKKALPATVLIEVEGRSYSGAIVGKDALVLTVGHAVAGSPPDVTLLLSDGRRAKGRVLGIDRAADTAMVKIVDEGDYPFVEIAPKAADLQGRDFLVTVAHPPDFQPGRPPSVGLVQVRGEMNGRIWADSSRPIIGSGGPLLIAGGGAADEGTLVGIQSGCAWGGFLYTPAADYQKSWNRLKQGGAWGQWGPGTGPLLGIYSAEDENGCKISQVVPGGPADKAGLRSGDVVKAIDGQNLKDSQALAPVLSGKDPGQEVNLQVQRGGNAMQVKLTLGRRK